MESELNLTMKIILNNRNDIIANLTLKNEDNQDLYIRKSTILLDMFRPRFYFTGPSEIECFHDNGLSKWIKISKQESISSLVSLSDYCNFKEVAEGLYKVNFVTSIIQYIDEQLTHFHKQQLFDLLDEFYLPGETVSPEEGA